MKKLLIGLLCCAALMLPVFAKEVDVRIPSFDVTLGGVKVDSAHRQFPLLFYKDITYVPMTYYDCRYLGLVTDWDGETQTLYIEKGDVFSAYHLQSAEKKNPTRAKAQIYPYNLVIGGKRVDNSAEEYPVLLYREIVYLPLTWRFAAEEFGWGYSFDAKNGLSITADTITAENIDLPFSYGAAATDGEYYYYNGKSGDKNVVYRVLVSDTSKPEIIHEVPNTPMSQRGASFQWSCGELYITYFAGTSPIMSGDHYYRINKDGTLTEQKPGNYSGGNHGFWKVTAEKDGIFVKGENMFVDGGTEFSYTVNGVETKLPSLGRIKLGKHSQGANSYSYDSNRMLQICGGAIYYAAYDIDAGTPSALYRIDIATATTEKLADNVCGFYAYIGRFDENSEVGTLIVFGMDGKIICYEAATGKSKVLHSDADTSLEFIDAVGSDTLCVLQKSIDGSKTVIKVIDTTSLEVRVLYETDSQTTFNVQSEKFTVTLYDAQALDAKFVVASLENGGELFRFADDAVFVYIYEDTLLYRTEDGAVKVDLTK